MEKRTVCKHSGCKPSIQFQSKSYHIFVKTNLGDFVYIFFSFTWCKMKKSL